MQSLIDTAITYRILRIMTTPWTSQNAYQLGIIDQNGNALKKSSELKTAAENNAYTILHRLVFRIKRLIERTPLGASQLVSYAAAIALIRECADQKIEPISLESIYLECLDESVDTSAVQHLLNTKELKSFSQFAEDASIVAANNTSGIIGTGDDNTTVIVKKKPTIQTRGIKNEVAAKSRKVVQP